MTYHTLHLRVAPCDLSGLWRKQITQPSKHVLLAHVCVYVFVWARLIPRVFEHACARALLHAIEMSRKAHERVRV